VVNWNVQGGDQEKIIEEIPTSYENIIYYDYEIKGEAITGTIHKNESHQEKAASDQSSDEYNNEDSRLNFSARFPFKRTVEQGIGLMAYVSIFIGIIVIVTTGSMLMVRQLAEAEEERENYQLLTKLGISRKKVKRVIFGQNAIMFFPPIILGSMHTFFAIEVFTQYVDTANYGLAYLICGSLVLIYILFYYITSVLYCRIIEE